MQRSDFRKFMNTTQTSPCLSMCRGGDFLVNSAAVEHFKLIGFKYVILYFSKTDNAIGLEFTNDPQVGAINLNKNEAKKSFRFRSSRFPATYNVLSFRPIVITKLPDSNIYFVVVPKG